MSTTGNVDEVRKRIIQLAREIEEAALVEGCSQWRVFYRVTIPMVKAPLATTVLFVFILNWSDYIIALLLTRPPAKDQPPTPLAVRLN